MSMILVLTLIPNIWCYGKKGSICDDVMAKPLTPPPHDIDVYRLMKGKKP